MMCTDTGPSDRHDFRVLMGHLAIALETGMLTARRRLLNCKVDRIQRGTANPPLYRRRLDPV
jgi:hypothetical protein